MTILVTGANGFIGQSLCSSLQRAGVDYRPVVRGSQSKDFLARGPTPISVGDLGPDTDWKDALKGVTSIVHLAARSHVMRDTAPDPLAEYRRINVEGTRHREQPPLFLAN